MQPRRLKRVFNIDIETSCKCGGDVRIIASIEDAAVISQILAHLDEKQAVGRLHDASLEVADAAPGLRVKLTFAGASPQTG
jgi:hypothetical protein